MRPRSAAPVLAAIGLLLTSPPARAHHSFAAEYDPKQPVTLHGTVTRMDWTNPHAWIYLNVKGPRSKVHNWMIEAGTPMTLSRLGLSKASLRPGTNLTVEGYRAKDGGFRAKGKEVVLPDGRKFVLGASPAIGP